MKNFSEKPRRGRPRAFTAETEKHFEDAGALDPRRTRRTHLNLIYQMRTPGLIWEHYEPAFAWLTDARAAVQAGTGKVRRRVILSEFGRIAEDKELIFAAQEICMDRPTTRRAVAMIRYLRTGRCVPRSYRRLAEAIQSAIDEYLEIRPEMTRDHIWKALFLLAASYEPDDEERGEDESPEQAEQSIE
jgi:hypothetical protein